MNLNWLQNTANGKTPESLAIPKPKFKQGKYLRKGLPDQNRANELCLDLDLSTREIAEILGVSTSAVSDRRKGLGLKFDKHEQIWRKG